MGGFAISKLEVKKSFNFFIGSYRTSKNGRELVGAFVIPNNIVLLPIFDNFVAILNFNEFFSFVPAHFLSPSIGLCCALNLLSSGAIRIRIGQTVKKLRTAELVE